MLSGVLDLPTANQGKYEEKRRKGKLEIGEENGPYIQD